MNKEKELHSCNEILIGLKFLAELGRAERESIWLAIKSCLYVMTWGKNFAYLYGQEENFHSCIIMKDEKNQFLKSDFL